MAFTPGSVVHFLNVPLENNYKNQIYFNNRSDQTTFMMTKRKHTFNDVSYIRKDNIIRVPEHIDNLYDCNYVMYKNSKYNDRWFYAFITKMEYINDGRTDVTIETDVWQTWFDKIDVKDSFVEREHVSDDIVGKHIVGENLQLGDYVCNMHTQAGYTYGKLNIVVGVTEDPNGDKVRGSLYDNIYSGLKYYMFQNSFTGVDALNKFLSEYDKDAMGEAIQCMFLLPQKLTGLIPDPDTEEETPIGRSNSVKYTYINDSSKGNINEEITMTRNTLDGYTPKNKKLLTYPYRYLLVSNNNGVSVPFEYEQFKVNDDIIKPQFTIEGCLSIGGSVRMIPLNYKGIERHDEEGINLGKFPTLNWNSDYFINWINQNSVNIGVSLTTDVAQAGLGVAGAVLSPMSAGLTGVMAARSVVSGVNGVGQTLGEVYKASKTPAQAKGNLNCGDVISANYKNDFHFYDMTIKAQFAEVIDNFFEMFGYKVNMVKKPNMNTRPYWNYVKTIDVNLDGEIPQTDLAKARAMFNNGVTFWKDGNKVEDYTQNNH